MMYDPGTLYSDPILTDFSVGYQAPTFGALRLLPMTPVRTKSGRYRVFGRERRVRFASRREPGTVANEVRGGRWSEDTFFTHEHSLQAAVADEEQWQLQSQGGYANPTFGGPASPNPEEDATALVNNSLQLEHEIAASTLLRNTATYPVGNTSTFGAADQWDNYAGATSDPVAVIRSIMIKISSLIGVMPNRMLMGALGANWLEYHPKVVSRFQYFSLTDPGAFRQLTGFDGEMVLIGDDRYNDNDIQESTEALVAAWGKDVILAYVEDEPTENSLTFGKTFSQIYPDGSTKPTDRWREEGRKSDMVRTSWSWDTKICTSSAGYLIVGAFSATAW